MFKQLQKIGKAFMLPIAILPAAGLLLGIGGALSNPNTVNAYPVLNIPLLQAIFKLMSATGEIVFVNLALLMAIGLAVGLAKEDKGTAGLAAAISFLVMNKSISALINILKPEGIEAIDTGVIGSIVIGLMVVFFLKRYRNIQLPSYLGFFGGSRFIPIISMFSAIVIGGLFFIIWPPFQRLLIDAGQGISKMGALGTFLYGFLLRLTGAVGLHHMIYPMFWYTELGGIETVAGVDIVGAQKIFFAQLADPNHEGLFTYGTRFFSGRFATMMFGLPGACLAMYHAAPKNKRKLVYGLFLSAALTSFLTGITEPIEFMFLFVAPWLYILHAFFDGVSFLVADLLKIRIGNTFSGGLIDYLLFGVLQGNDKTHWVWVLVVGTFWFFLYYFTFRLLIKRFNVPTPGRTDDDEVVNTSEDVDQRVLSIIEALGGAENIEEVEACITRLRISLIDDSLSQDDELKRLGASGVLKSKGGLQAVFGTTSNILANKINKQLNAKI